MANVSHTLCFPIFHRFSGFSSALLVARASCSCARSLHPISSHLRAPGWLVRVCERFFPSSLFSLAYLKSFDARNPRGTARLIKSPLRKAVTLQGELSERERINEDDDDDCSRNVVWQKEKCVDRDRVSGTAGPSPKGLKNTSTEVASGGLNSILCAVSLTLCKCVYSCRWEWEVRLVFGWKFSRNMIIYHHM